MYEIVEVPVSDKSRFYQYHKTWFKWKNTETGELSIQAYTSKEVAEAMLQNKYFRDGLSKSLDSNIGIIEHQDKVGI